MQMYHCIEESCGYREELERSTMVCPDCGSYLVREETPDPVILGKPHPYPEEKPEVRGVYLAWMVLPRDEYWRISVYGPGILVPRDSFGRWDNVVTHWLPMPPSP